MGWLVRLRENPWRSMIAVNIAVVIGVFLYKITREPYVPYIHLLVDYHFGFIKRALIGETVALLSSKVPVWLVFVLAGAVSMTAILALAPFLSSPADLPRTAAGMFTISYTCAIIIPTICGALWDLTGRPWTAFVPLCFCAVALAVLGTKCAGLPERGQ